MSLFKPGARLVGQRIVFIARHFEPLISGGSRRSLALATALRAQGATVLIVAPKAGSEFETLVVPHPQPEPVIVTPDASPGFAASIKGVIQRHLFLPDPDIRWALRASKAVEASGREFDWVLTSSPPESCHVAGARLSCRLGLKWIADFRDHWFASCLLESRLLPVRLQTERRLAKKWLRKADISMAVSDAIAEEISQVSGRPVATIPQMTFSTPISAAAAAYTLPDDKVHVAHTGAFSLSDPGRKIDQFLEVLSQARAKNPALQAHLIGRLTESEQAQIQNSNQTGAIKCYGTLDYTTTLALQARMQGLIACSAPNSPVIPGKFYEYQRIGLPIVTIGGAALHAVNHQTEPPATVLARFTADTHPQPSEIMSYDIEAAGRDIATLMTGPGLD